MLRLKILQALMKFAFASSALSARQRRTRWMRSFLYLVETKNDNRLSIVTCYGLPVPRVARSVSHVESPVIYDMVESLERDD